MYDRLRQVTTVMGQDEKKRPDALSKQVPPAWIGW